MGLGKWMMSLLEPTPRGRDKTYQKDMAKKQKNRVTRQPPQPVVSTQMSSSPEPAEVAQPEPLHEPLKNLRAEDHTSYVQPYRTAVEINAINHADLGRAAMGAQQQEMTQAQMNAMAHSINQELAMLTGMGQDPLSGAASTPYWQRMYGELGKNLGPFHPQNRSGK